MTEEITQFVKFQGEYHLRPPNTEENYNEIAYVSLVRHLDNESFYAKAIGTESLLSLFTFIRNKMKEDGEKLAKKASDNVIFLAIPKEQKLIEESGVLAVLVSDKTREELIVAEGSVFQLSSMLDSENKPFLMIGY